MFAITSDLEDQAEQFRSLVGATRDELVESLVKRAEEAATQQQETAQIIMDGLTDHAAEVSWRVIECGRQTLMRP